MLNHVLMHQTVIGLETMQQMEMAGEEPDVVIGCAGGGSNFAGFSFPFLGAKLARQDDVPRHRRRARGCPSLTEGNYAYDFGDTAQMTPLVKMHTLGHDFMPDADPRRRPALPRHGAARLACSRSTA